MDILKRLTTRCQQAEVIHLCGESVVVEYEANKLKASRAEQTEGLALRVVKGGRLGFAASTDMRDSDSLLSSALDSAAFGEETTLRFPSPQAAPTVETYDPRIAELPAARLVDIGRESLDVILAACPEARVNISLTRSVDLLELENSAGTRVAFRRSPLVIIGEAWLIQNDDIRVLFEVATTAAWESDYTAFARRLGEKLRAAKNLATVGPGRMPVLFSPTGFAALTAPLLEGLNGKNAFTGTSPLAGKVGEKLFHERFTVVDDGTLAGRPGSGPFDDEGVPHRRHTLVDKGVLTGFLYDLRTAARSGAEPTGNGSRSLFAPPEPAPANLLVCPGDTPRAEMIRGIADGLLVEDVLGAGQGNVISGAFSNPLDLAFRIHNGEIVGRVKNSASISGNIYEPPSGRCRRQPRNPVAF